ncbi:MAG: CDP-glycerol glycerophosphotransferase family protein [Lachnospiraceae bacterium]|nr:CDP-glycerol glycerophosphotransferase family protein [Lachnospiraceae bacterium]
MAITKEKIINKLTEGRLLRKTAQKILDAPDRWLGTAYRKHIAKKTPTDPKKVMFIAFQGDYTCNPKYICEELKRQKVDCNIVWMSRKASSLSGYKMEEPEDDELAKQVIEYGQPAESNLDITIVKNTSADFYRELASAKIWIANSVEFLKQPTYKKKDQVFIETWHGSLGIKRFDASANSGKGWVRAAKYTTKVCDYLISNSDFEDDVYRGSFWPTQKIWRFGHPRNDIIVDPEKRAEIKRKIYEHYEIEDDVRICMYAPTFRDSHSFDIYDIDYYRLVAALEAKFGGRWKVLLRFHPTVRKYAEGKVPYDPEIMVKGTRYNDMQELIAATDIAITDYSSWIYDFMLTGLPGFIFATDIADYMNERGFYYSLYDTPFPVCTNNDELIEAIKNFDMDAYAQKNKEFLEGKGCVEDGRASERVVEEIKKILGNA